MMERWSKYQADFLLDQENEAKTKMSNSVLLSMQLLN